MSDLPILIFTAVCLGIAGYAGRLFFAGLRSRSWPSTTGTITTSRIETSLFSGTGQSKFKPVLRLKYSYTVEGQSRTGSRITVAPNGWFSVGTPASLQHKYPEGAQVPVFYRPGKSTMSVLERGIPGRLWSFYAIAAMFALIGLLELFNIVGSLLGSAA